MKKPTNEKEYDTKVSVVTPTTTVGLVPGTTEYSGDAHLPIEITVTIFDKQGVKEKLHPNIATTIELANSLKEHQFAWISLIGMSSTSEIKQIADALHLHSMYLEDVLQVSQRPKIAIDSDYLLFVLKSMELDSENKLAYSQVGLYLSQRIVLTLHEKRVPSLSFAEQNVELFFKQVPSRGTDVLAFYIIDQLVDQYFRTLELLEDTLDDLEDEAIYRPSQETLEQMHGIKRELIVARRTIYAMRQVFLQLRRTRSGIVRSDTYVYFEDIFDHLTQLHENAENLREVLLGIMDLYMSSVGNKSNEIMMVLTIIATIFIPHTFIVGVYGMNFKYMPELAWKYGYFIIWTIMILLAFGEVLYFKKKGWLN